jgi:GNAT superfamily N-acetyltransferase
MISDGYTDLPPGKIASVVTYLEMRARPAAAEDSSSAASNKASVKASNEVNLRKVQSPELDWYRALYRRAGEQWLWFSRLAMTDAELRATLHSPSTELFVGEREGDEIGIAELDRSQSPNVEITSFALFPKAIGRGFGRSFMAQLLARAWTHPTARVWLHTCNLDSPAALSFYIKCGFHPYKLGIEVADDPRIRGILPQSAAPQVPIIR